MNRIVFGCSGVALALGLAACDTNFKATDKLMRNEHRVIQNTRVFQQPNVVRQEVQQIAAAPIVQQVQPVVQPVIQQVEQQVVEVEPVKPVIEKKIVTRNVTPEPIYKTVYIDAPAQVINRTSVSQRINIRTLSKTQIFTLQRSLAAKGFYKAPIDGIFGIRTAQALATYQSNAGTSGPVTSQILEGLGLFI